MLLELLVSPDILTGKDGDASAVGLEVGDAPAVVGLEVGDTPAVVGLEVEDAKPILLQLCVESYICRNISDNSSQSI